MILPGDSAAKQDPALDTKLASLVGQSSACPPGSTPFDLTPWLGADITVACGLRSERRHGTQGGIARLQITYEYMTNTPQEDIDTLGNALKAAGFSEKAQRVCVKYDFDSVNVWTNAERKPDFRNPRATGAIGIDMSHVGTTEPNTSAN